MKVAVSHVTTFACDVCGRSVMITELNAAIPHGWVRIELEFVGDVRRVLLLRTALDKAPSLHGAHFCGSTCVAQVLEKFAQEIRAAEPEE